MTYRRRVSPLHAARAVAGIAWCAGLGVAALLESNPIVLGGVIVAILAGGAAARAGRELRRALWLAIPLAMTVALINALVTRNGLTVIWRFGNLPVLGQTDVTLEATAYGGILGLRAAALVLCGVLYSVCVDPDDVLRLLRRWSFRSALTATVATRMLPVLLRDSTRLAEAQRCRPGPPPGRVALMRATTAGVLDRALDVAAALEVRGYGASRSREAGRPAGGGRRGRPWSRHDFGFLASGLAVVVLAVVGRVSGLAGFTAYPSLHLNAGAGTLSLTAGLVACALMPFADRRGIEP
ncbi:MAG TPA: energy-coupling factor transporter transmembrane component T [Solirubrobacteraceae bacterium]|nr:energy-coupling factor transporter transmembrane component T [Solirubrobacteraceae bacterium]